MAEQRRLGQAEAAVKQHLRPPGEAQRGGIGRIALLAATIKHQRPDEQKQQYRKPHQTAPGEGIEKLVVQMAEGGEVGGGVPAVLVGIQLRRARAEERIANPLRPGKAPHFKTRADGGIRLAFLIKGDVVLRLGQPLLNHLNISEPEQRRGDGDNQRRQGDAARAEMTAA